MGTVWILGAGFSKPLGGPLLGNLLSPEAEELIGLAYPPNQWPELFGDYADAVRRLYWYGFRPGDGRDELRKRWANACSENLWQDAEQYLDYLDTAATFECPARDRLSSILGSRVATGLPQGEETLKRLTTVGRRLLAAECCAFLEGVANLSEQWTPYRRWLHGGLFVWGQDTVVTFNYDLVPEMLADANKQRDLFRYSEKRAGTSLLLKLHGSVNWTLEHGHGNPTGVSTDAGIRAALKCSARELAIAGPGPEKQALSKGVFKQYWDLALEAIKSAHAIVFVGYRFPPTDAEAREKLLGAIRRNEEQYLAIHTVLGPDTSSDDSRRLRGLLEHAMAGVRKHAPQHVNARYYTLWQHPLFAEDFFSVVDGRSITSPYQLGLP